MEKLLDGVEVEWKALESVFNILAGGDVPKDAFSDVKTQRYNIPILSNGIGDKALYGWTDKEKIEKPSLTISARGTIGWTSYRDIPFFPIVRLIVLTPKIELNLKYAYYFMKTIENGYKVPPAGIPQLTKPMLRKFQIPIPCPNNPEKSLAIQAEIVRILDTFTELTTEFSARKKQYNYYRDQLLSFEEGTTKDTKRVKVEWKALGEITRVSSASRVHKNEWTTSGVPFFRTSDVISIFNGVKNSRDDAFISNELYETLSSKSGKTQKNDILVTGGGTIGIPYIVPTDEPLYFKDADLLCIKKSKTLNSKFLYHYFLTTKFRIYLENISHNSTIAHYTISQIKKNPVPVPPLEEQSRIVAILDKFDTLTSSISEGLPREIELRQKQYEYYRDLLLSFPKPELEV